MAAARQKEMKLSSAVVATRTRGIPFPWPPGAAGFWGELLINGYFDLQEAMLPLFLQQVQLAPESKRFPLLRVSPRAQHTPHSSGVCEVRKLSGLVFLQSLGNRRSGCVPKRLRAFLARA